MKRSRFLSRYECGRGSPLAQMTRRQYQVGHVLRLTAYEIGEQAETGPAIFGWAFLGPSKGKDLLRPVTGTLVA
jgi:hypothetical protein